MPVRQRHALARLRLKAANLLCTLVMATVHDLRVPQPPTSDGVLNRLGHLLELELELGVAETRDVVIAAVIAIAVALVAAITAIAALVVLIAGALAPLFGAHWEHLVIVGGGVLLLSMTAITWSALRLRRLRWPRETLTSFEENWRWLARQLRSRLTLP